MVVFFLILMLPISLLFVNSRAQYIHHKPNKVQNHSILVFALKLESRLLQIYVLYRNSKKGDAIFPDANWRTSSSKSVSDIWIILSNFQKGTISLQVNINLHCLHKNPKYCLTVPTKL